MSKVNYAIVISSLSYKDLIYTALERNDIMFLEPVKEDEKYLLSYVKKNMTQIAEYDAFIIDLGVLKDSDEQIMEAIEAVRYLDDKIRIIILESTRTDSYKLLHQCFLNGIYNLIPTDNFLSLRDALQKCLIEGMSYKDSLDFRNETRKKKSQEMQHFTGKKTIVLLGTQNRMGTTWCTLAVATTLKEAGYLTAIADNTGTTDYYHIMQSYSAELLENTFFTIDEIDFYMDFNHLEEKGYNFVLYDLGSFEDFTESKKNLYQEADICILLTGSKPWELTHLSQALADTKLQKENTKYLFNFTNNGMEKELLKLMKGAGIKENQVFFMEYQNELFTPSQTIKTLLEVDFQATKKKNRFFIGKTKKHGKNFSRGRKT